jgi:putative ABC transport system permease protein
LLPAVLALDPVARVRLGAVSLDWRVLAATLLLSFAVTLVASIAPVLRDAWGRHGSALVDAGRRTTGGGGVGRAWLIASETALALVLLSSAILIFRGFDATARRDPGFDPDRALGAQLRLSEAVYSTPESRNLLLQRVLDAVRASPAVADAATTINVLIPGNAFVTLAFPTETPQPGESGVTVQFRRISDGYFRTMRIPIEAGRDFDARDTLGTELVAIVSRRFVDAYLPGVDPIGLRVRRGQPTFPPVRIVGVVGDVSDVGFGQEPQPTIYTPYRQGSTVAVPISLIVRTAGPPAAAVPALRGAIRSVDPAQPLANVVMLEDYLSDSLGAPRFRSVLLGVFAAIGLLLASLGVYGVTARAVVERTREVGVRLALGGSARSVWGRVARRPLAALAAGATAGAGLAALARQVISSSIAGLDAGAMPTIGAAAGVLMACGAAAALIPAWRATRVDPLTALRTD